MGNYGGVDYGAFGSPKPTEPGYQEYVNARTPPPPEAESSGSKSAGGGRIHSSPGWTDDRAAKRCALFGACVGVVWGCVVAPEGDRLFLAGLFALLGAAAGYMLGLFWKLLVTLAVIAGALYIWASMDDHPTDATPRVGASHTAS